MVMYEQERLRNELEQAKDTINLQDIALQSNERTIAMNEQTITELRKQLDGLTADRTVLLNENETLRAKLQIVLDGILASLRRNK